MIGLAMPVGSSHGWGICGKYISRELAALTGGQVRIMADQFTAESVGDELEFLAAARLRLTQQDIAGAKQVGNARHLPFPLISSIVDKQMMPWQAQFRGSRTLGYTFFEENIFEPASLDNARQHYDLIATGSTWCTEVLKHHGLANVHTVIQGIDRASFFHGRLDVRRSATLRDRFVIFSGGKFELRKGQDIVIRAVQVMQQRHADVVLVNAWYNPWQHSFDTMRASPHMRWPTGPVSGQYGEVMNRLLTENGLDPQRVITLAPRANALMARIYRNSDVGIFPNRCEGGTNLVLMEYMACGKPVVAVNSTGHSDIVRPDNALVIPIKTEKTYNGANGKPTARWPEPDLDATISLLEEAYQNRPRLEGLGKRAGEDLANITWTVAAQRFLELING